MPDIPEIKSDLPAASALGREARHNYNVAVYGDHGSGKTAWTEEILLANKKRLFIIDTNCDDYGEPDFCEACHIHYDAIITDIKKISQHVTKENFRIVVRCPGQEMEALKIFKYRQQERSAMITDCTICVEEIQNFMDGATIEPIIKDIVTLGRHSRNNFVGVSQIPRGQTNLLYRSQMEIFVSFRQTEEAARKFFADFDKEKADRLREFECGEYDLFRGSKEKLLEFIESEK